jgi:hypothetical protein
MLVNAQGVDEQTVTEIERQIAQIEVKRKKQLKENQQRKHNYVGLIFELLKSAAIKGQL